MTAQPRTVISESLLPAAVELLAAKGPVHLDPGLHAKPAELARLLAGAEALVVRNQTRVTEELLAQAPALKVVGRLGVGLDNLDLPALARRGVAATWAPGMNATSVAEYVLGAMLSLVRRFGPLTTQLVEGSWNRDAGLGLELHGKQLGLIGAGDIGGRVASRARAFGMRVVAADPVLTPASYAAQELGVVPVELGELLATSDFVSLHAPLGPQTHHLLREETLSQLGRGAFVINTARGGLIDEAALAAALSRGDLAGAALDVREHEPPGPDDPLASLQNVILTPHVAGRTHESEERVALAVATDVARVLDGRKPLHPVPLPTA